MCKSRLILATCASLIAVATATNSRPAAQAPDPRTLPRLEYANLEYLGRFRLPNTSSNGQWFSFAQGYMAYYPAGDGGNGSLFFGSGNAFEWTGNQPARMAELSIPEPSLSANINTLPMAGFLQGFVDPTEGHLDEIDPPANDYTALHGHIIVGDTIVGTAIIGYDADGHQIKSHYSRSTNLSQPSFSGWSQLPNVEGKAGFVAGQPANIPTEWQTALGGVALTGNCCVSIVSRTSWGPAAFLFNPASIGAPTVSTTPLLYYSGAHPTLGLYNTTEINEVWGQSTKMGGFALINGTRTALFFGSTGIGVPCYGRTTPDPALHNHVYDAEGHTECYDPTNTDSGNHAYPYRFQLWAYDLNDLADVKAGTKAPWEPRPVVWPLNDLPSNDTMETMVMRPGGIAYAPDTQRLYVAADLIDVDGYSSRPLIYVFKVNVPSGNTVSAVDIAADRSSPQPVNTTINWTAAATGGVTPLQYKWSVNDGAAWQDMTAWSTSNQFAWTPASPGSSYQVRVWARSAGNSTDIPEASDDETFTISGGSGAASAITITPDQSAPQPAGTPITWTAAVTGGTTPLQYRWWFWDGGSSFDQTGWTSSGTFTWTPVYGNAGYAIKAWVRSAGNSSETPEAQTEVPFPTTGPGPATDVSLATSHSSPQPLGTAITWTATPTGGVPQQEYKFFTLEPSGWVMRRDWSTTNTFLWTFTQAGAANKVAVWVRSHGNTNDAAEAARSEWFTIQ
jgi:hypothetical protein